MVNILLRSVLFSVLMLCQAAFGNSLLPPPLFKSAVIAPTAVYDNASGFYRYQYSINNPSSNTGEIWKFRIDISVNANSGYIPDNGLTISLGSQNIPFWSVRDALYSINSFRQKEIIPFGQTVPAGWNGGLEINGYAVFSNGDTTPNIVPGNTMGGFELQSYGIPTIREAQLLPLWMYVTDDHDTDTDADIAAGGVTEQSLVFSTQTLGPSSVSQGSYQHWDQVQNDLQTAILLQWIPDSPLSTKLTSQLASARQSLSQQDGTAAKNKLSVLIDLVQAAPMSNIKPSAASLLVLNAQALINNTPDTPIPFEPKLSATPKLSMFPIGATAIIQVTLVNAGDNNKPLSGYSVRFRIEQGVNSYDDSKVTDQNGSVTFSYQGISVGTDKFVVSYGQPVQYAAISTLVPITFSAGRILEDRGVVVWSGGPDLVVPMFIPPVLKTGSDRIFYVTEATQNKGNTAAGPSVTRYFITGNPDYITDRQVISQRQVPVLAPGEISYVSTVALSIPSNLPIGTYYLSACADSDGAVPELNEDNNCSYSTIEGSQSVIVPIENPNNQPPVCTNVLPSTSLLWPPNHKLAAISILNVTDPEKDTVKIFITGITQDEPVNGLGDGDTAPDGFGVGTSTAQVRAERSGLGNGRVYNISFRADDGKNGSCTGSVRVGVPHDQGKGSTPVDDGQFYDSTQP